MIEFGQTPGDVIVKSGEGLRLLRAFPASIHAAIELFHGLVGGGLTMLSDVVDNEIRLRQSTFELAIIYRAFEHPLLLLRMLGLSMEL